jgi:hypothetical protein
MSNKTSIALNFSLLETWFFEDVHADVRPEDLLFFWVTGCGLMRRGMCRVEMSDRTETERGVVRVE